MEKEKIAEVNGYELYVVQDECPPDPRGDYDHLGRMHLRHSGYSLPNECENDDQFSAMVVLPVYMLDHSGLRFSTRDFKDGWDSGCVGFIAAFEDDVRRWYNCEEITDEVRRSVRECLEEEVREYDDYMNGNVWGFVIEKDGDHVDSCWGYYGDVGRKDGECEWRANLYYHAASAFKGYKEGSVA